MYYRTRACCFLDYLHLYNALACKKIETEMRSQSRILFGTTRERRLIKKLNDNQLILINNFWACTAVSAFFQRSHMRSSMRSIGLKITRAIDLVWEPKWNAKLERKPNKHLNQKWKANGAGTLKERWNSSTSSTIINQ